MCLWGRGSPVAHQSLPLLLCPPPPSLLLLAATEALQLSSTPPSACCTTSSAQDAAPSPRLGVRGGSSGGLCPRSSHLSLICADTTNETEGVKKERVRNQLCSCHSICAVSSFFQLPASPRFLLHVPCESTAEDTQHEQIWSEIK